MASPTSLIPAFFLFNFLSEVTSQCGSRPLEISLGRNPLIVNGRTARYGELPWQAALLYNGQYYCGGALVHKQFILTAGHCAQSATDVTKLVIRLGEYDLNSDNPKPHVEAKVAKIIIHESFQREPTPIFDMALLQLDKEIEFGENIQPICLANGIDTYAGQVASIGGWGKNASNGVVNNILQMVDVPVITNELCQEWVKKRSKVVVRPDWMCAGYELGGKDACTGDSGGPLWLKSSNGQFIIIGVTSAGFDCAQPYLPGIYTRINMYTDWFNQKIQEATNAIPVQRMLELLAPRLAAFNQG